jgi:1,4-alpha-glucan branching enzyme
MPDHDVQQVAVAGDFSDREPIQMRRLKDGTYRETVDLHDGNSAEYKFLVDGQWIADPDNAECRPNPFGSCNSVVEIH